MTKKEKQIKCLIALGLNIGDNLVFEDGTRVTIKESDYRLYLEEPNQERICFDYLFEKEYKIAKCKGKLGDKRCGDTACYNCPLNWTSCSSDVNKTLFQQAGYLKSFMDMPRKVYDDLMDILDEEFEELEDDE